MKSRNSLVVWLLLLIAFMAAGCHSDRDNPKDLLNRYFTATLNKDYAATYACYYDAYKKRVSRDEYVRYRSEASVLKAYTIKSISKQGDFAQAEVELTFDASPKLKRDHPVTTLVKEDMVRENGAWKIRVW